MGFSLCNSKMLPTEFVCSNWVEMRKKLRGFGAEIKKTGGGHVAEILGESELLI